MVDVEQEQQLWARLVGALGSGQAPRELLHPRCVDEDSGSLNGKTGGGQEEGGAPEGGGMVAEEEGHGGCEENSKASVE